MENSITIAWQPPKQASGKIDSYEITYNGQVTSVTPTTLETTLSGLTANKLYEISVIAKVGDLSGQPAKLRIMTKPTGILNPFKFAWLIIR